MAETKNTEKQNIEIQKEEEKRESVRKADAAVKSMHDFTSPEVLYQELIKSVKKYHPSTDISMIEKAYKVASEAHKDQKRKSGEPYIIHPLCVAIILADLELDKETIVAGLLHDAVEDTWMTYEEVEKEFGSEVALLVDGVTKLGQLSYSKDKVEVQAENLRKMFLAMAKDIRVILIKLADRLHNMRTLQYMRPEKQQEKARETMDIYAPIAMRLGISKIKVELDDLSLKYLKPDVYYDLVEKVALRKSAREEFVNSIVKQVKQHMEDANIRAQVDGRVKHFFSIYKKMVNQDKTIDQIYDLFAVRIIVDTVKDCYAALGVIHEMYKPIPGRFKDYIAMPKANMYQSLHTTLIGPNGQPFEIQIRTFEMHKTAEYGIAAHWKYKEGITTDKEEVNLSWLRQALEWQKDANDPKEFMESLKMDLFSSQVFVFTPNGDVIELPAGATPLDFAFKIHSDVGYKCVGAKDNGKMVTIDHPLENGDIVEIVTNPNAVGPSIDWLKIAKSSSARNKIRQWLKKENKTDAVDKGKDLIDRYMRKKGYDPRELLKNAFVNKAVKALGYKNTDELYTQLSNGGSLQSKLVSLLLGYDEEEKHAEAAEKEQTLLDNLHEISERAQRRAQNARKMRKNEKSGVKVEGVDNLMIRMARCCNPVPGDDIIGFITKGRGISVHRKDCDNLKSLPPQERARFIDVSWDTDNTQDKSFNAELTLIAKDQKSMISSISKICEDLDVDISGLNAKANKDETVVINLNLSIQNKEQMEKIIRSLKNVPGIMEAYRTKS